MKLPARIFALAATPALAFALAWCAGGLIWPAQQEAPAASSSAGLDFPSALAVARQQPDSTEQLIQLYSVPRDPGPLLAALASETPPVRQAIIGNVAAGWVRPEPEKFLAALKAAPGLSPVEIDTLLDITVRHGLWRRAGRDKDAALLLRDWPGHLKAWGPPLVTDWAARENGQAALDWVLSLKDEAARTSLAEAIHSLPELKTPVRTTEADAKLDRLLAEVSNVGNQQPSGLAGLSPAQRRELMGLVYDQIDDPREVSWNWNMFVLAQWEDLQKGYPAEYAAWLLTRAGKEEMDFAVSKFARFWSAEEPAAAAAWAGKLPPGNTRTAALRDIATQWHALDPASATHWLTQFPPAERAAIREKPPATR